MFIKEKIKPIINKYLDENFMFFNDRYKWKVLERIYDKLLEDIESLPVSNNDTKELIVSFIFKVNNIIL